MSRLPAGYIEVEYIESDGKQYINTGFYTTATSVEYHIVYGHDSLLSSAGLFGARESDPARDSGWVNVTSGGNLAIYIGATSVAIGVQHVGRVNDLTLEIKSDTEYSYSSNGVGGNKTYTGEKSENIPQYLFAVNTSGTMRYPSAMKVYSFSITENGKLARNFVPCKRTDGEVGMYDTVTATFFGNSGSGAFVAGNIVMSQWLVTDRTEHDVNHAKKLASKTLADMTSEERTEWLSPMKGSYNYTDLNRVEAAVLYVAERMKEYGYLRNLPNTRVWTMADKPNSGELIRYLGNVEMLRNTISILKDTPRTPTSMENFDVSKANALEQILIDIDQVLNYMKDIWFYAGDLYLAEV